MEKKGKRPAVEKGTLHPKLIVGIGGSAGALNAYKALLDAMPSDTGMAFVIISHMNPIAVSELAKILSRHTKMTVKAASMAMPIRANNVYIIPPDSDLSIEKNKFKVISPRSERIMPIARTPIASAKEIKNISICLFL